MKRIITADTHLSLYANDKLKKGIGQRLYDILAMLDIIAKFATKHKIEEIDILGDVFNDKDIIYTKSMVLLTKFFARYAKIEFKLMTGNHDLDNTSDEQLSILESIEAPNVECINEKKVVDNITYIPYSKNVVQEVMSASPNDILLSHFGLNEGILNSGISMVSDIGIKDLRHFKFVILGHYHNAQEMTNGKTDVCYVGSPIQKDWGEKHQDKRFMVLDNEEMKVESVPLTGYTRYIELVIEEAEQAKEVLAKCQELKDEGNHVRIKNKSDKKMNEVGVQIIEEVDIDPTNRGILLSMSFEEKVKKYMDIKEIPVQDRERYMKILTQTLGL